MGAGRRWMVGSAFAVGTLVAVAAGVPFGGGDDSRTVLQAQPASSEKDKDVKEVVATDVMCPAACIGAGEIADGAVGDAAIAADAVSSDEIEDGSIAVGDLDDASVDSVYAKDTDVDVKARAAVDPIAALVASFRDPVNGGLPNSSTPGDGLVDWSRLTGVPRGFADNVDDDGSAAVRAFADELRSTVASGPNSGNGRLDFSQLENVSIGDGLITGVDAAKISGRITSSQIGDGAVGFRGLASEIIARFDAVEKRVADLATPLGTAGSGGWTVDHSRVTNGPQFTVATVSPTSDHPVAPGPKVEIALSVVGARPGDSVFVTPPLGFPDALLVVGAQVTGTDVVTVAVVNRTSSTAYIRVSDALQLMLVDLTP